MDYNFLMNIYVKTISSLILLVCIVPLSGCASRHVIHYAEMADPRLDEIAMIRLYRDERAMVIYNPATCDQLGNACRFFRTHAYAHYYLRNVIMAGPEYYTPLQEQRADCWAAKQINAAEVEATISFLRDTERHVGLKIYGDPAQRAELIETCAATIVSQQ